MKTKIIIGILLTLFLTSVVMLAFNIQQAKASGTIYIRANGTVEGTDKIQRVGNVYTFTDNINNSIVVERNGIVIDGAGYTLQGTGSGTGIYMSGRTNVTVKNTQIKNFRYGVYLDSSSNNSISENNITNNENGVRLYFSSSNSVIGNNITNNNYCGVWLSDSSSSNTVIGNNITNNDYGVYLDSSSSNTVIENTFTNNGLVVLYSHQNVVEDNNVNGKPLVYLEGVADYSVANAGQVILVNCTRVRVENLNLSRASFGVELWETKNSVIIGNNITNNNYCGVLLEYSSSNTISGNNITNNENGVGLVSSSNNWFYHNNFIDNSVQVYSTGSTNVWDDGYPSGGNYWSDYTGVDANGDGIGDTPYVIDSNNQDRYPLVNQWVIPEFPSPIMLSLLMTFTTLAIASTKRKIPRKPKI